MIICSRPECQTTAGCKCVARTGEPLEPERLKAAILVRDTELSRLREEIAALRAQILADEEMINTLRAELEDQAKYGISEIAKAQISVRDAELERLRAENEGFAAAGTRWALKQSDLKDEISRLRAALEKLSGAQYGAAGAIARAALTNGEKE